ncbi:MAG: ComEC/Rec2 family competence protein [Patescibacteria group bacterium]
MKFWSPSRQFVWFWLALIAGVVLGRYFQFPVTTLAWIGGLWLLVYISGQAWKIEVLSLTLFGLVAGVLLWQVTDGEGWLHLELLTQFQTALVGVRDSIVERIFLALPEPHGSLLAGILLGNRVRLDRDLLEVFRLVGLSHIIAVSGYNLTILTANIRSVLRPMLGRKMTLAVAAVAVVSFVLLSGAPPSIIRAAVMAGILLWGDYLGRPQRSLGALALAAGVIVLFQPKIIFDIGFQLSIAATYGLIRLAPVITHALGLFKIPAWLKLVLGETLAATIMTAPLIIAVFERLAVVSPLSNILVVPLIPLLMTIGIGSVILLFVFPAVGSVATLLTWPILQWIIFVGEKLSALQFASTNLALSAYASALIMLVFFIGSEMLNARYQAREREITV